MQNNDILRRIRYIFDYTDSEMINLFSLGGQQVSRSEVSNWLKREEAEDYQGLYDNQLATFLNGLILDKRGKKDGAPPIAEKETNNNIVFRKLKIAFTLKDTDVLEILELAGMHISRHELSAFFRNPNQSQYRPCKDQILRNFLQGMLIKYQKTNH